MEVKPMKGEAMKHWKCKIGLHKWHELDRKYIGLEADYVLFNKICLRPGCGAKVDQIGDYEASEKQRKKQHEDDRELAVRLWKETRHD